MAQDWQEMSAAQMGRAIGRGEVDPREVTADFLGAIAAHEFGARIYARLTPDRAMAEAEAAAKRARLGLRLSPLDGVPVSWKDLFDSAGVATEAGSDLLKGRVPTRDAEVLRNGSAMGLICLGKTHMSELAFSGLGFNPVTQTPPCVNDRGAVSGGSSSGAAASVAFGLAAGAIGSDTGGSVRIPAAWNDLVGLKTTSGRVSLKGVVPLCKRYDTVGPLARTVEDAALLLAAIEGAKPADLRGARIKGARIAALQTAVLDDMRGAPMAAYRSAIERLEDAGAVVEKIDAPEVARALDQSAVSFTGEAYGLWREVIEAAPDKMYSRILERFRSGAGFSAADYVASWEILFECRALWNARVAGYDAVILPSAPILPPDLARLAADEDYYVTENLLALRNTRVGNVLGLSAITLPTGVPSCGVILMGKPMGEEALLRLAHAAEAALS
ncbi:amidase family protein [Litorivita sp. NS0012-18]|uniref:amidase n=1 Tax=Litorivita sp. NS0012-18 TaxID=3127655 RepID=UPI00310A9E6E